MGSNTKGGVKRKKPNRMAVKVISEREKVAITEKQCELINQMGLIHGGDIQQMMGMMVDMEKRDNKLAAEKGENTLNHDNTFL